MNKDTFIAISDEISRQHAALLSGVDEASSGSGFFPLFSADNDLDLEYASMPFIKQADAWSVADMSQKSPISYAVAALEAYFDKAQEVYGMDGFIYDNGITVSSYFADARKYANGKRCTGTRVENMEDFVFAEAGIDEDGEFYFEVAGSYKTDPHLFYGLQGDGGWCFAATDKVVAEIVSGDIEFDINLLFKDGSGDPFVSSQHVSGQAGDVVNLTLDRKISGVTGTDGGFDGVPGDKIRIMASRRAFQA